MSFAQVAKGYLSTIANKNSFSLITNMRVASVSTANIGQLIVARQAIPCVNDSLCEEVLSEACVYSSLNLSILNLWPLTLFSPTDSGFFYCATQSFFIEDHIYKTLCKSDHFERSSEVFK